MSTHESGDDIGWMKIVRLPERFELLDFILEIQPVAALAFNRGGPVQKHPVEAGETEGDKLFFGRFTRGFDRCLDSHALLSQLLISGAFEAQDELLLSGSGKRKVRVGIDKSWKPDQPASFDTVSVVL